MRHRLCTDPDDGLNRIGKSLMKAVVLTLLATALVTTAAGAAFVYFGIFNVAATDPHWPITYWVMETARVRSIKAHAAGIILPPKIDDQAQIVSAAGHFSAHCDRVARTSKRAPATQHASLTCCYARRT